MEGFLTGRVAKIGLDEEAFVPYLSSLACDSDADEPLRDRLNTALENIGAENFGVFVDELVAFFEDLKQQEKNDEECKEKQARFNAEQSLQSTKVLRGNAVSDSASAQHKDETAEERKRRLELLARYDVPDEIVMDASGKVVVRDVSEKTVNVDGNDNAERVRMAGVEHRERQKVESAKQKELSKTSAFDGKKKKAEAKEKRREKAVKVERKGGKGN